MSLLVQQTRIYELPLGSAPQIVRDERGRFLEDTQTDREIPHQEFMCLPDSGPEHATGNYLVRRLRAVAA